MCRNTSFRQNAQLHSSGWFAGIRVASVCVLAAVLTTACTVLAETQQETQSPKSAENDQKGSASKAPPAKLQHPAAESLPSPNVLVELNGALEALAAKVSPAVVQILVTGYGQLQGEEKSQTAFIVRQHAVGSGVVVDPSGYIVTNAHVVAGAQRIQVALPLSNDRGQVPIGKRRILEARLIGLHKESDVALLKIDGNDLPTLQLGSRNRPQVGQLVFAIGSPEGLQNSVTMGVLSALARQPDPSKSITYLQTDAPINPGNSGGPLVDMNGDVLGINTFILSEGGGSEGLGFAIPARVVDFVYRSLRLHGHVHRIEIGAVAEEITPDLAAGLELPQRWGVVVVDVTPDGPAQAAGLKIQDIVLSADDRRIETLPSLSSALYLHRLDQPVKLEVLRGKERKILYIPAIETHDHMDELLDRINQENSLVARLGILGIDLTSDLKSRLNLRIPSGVIVVGRAVDLLMPETGLEAGDIIHALNLTPIENMDTLRAALNQLKKGDPVVLQVERSDGLMYVSFEME